MKTRRMARLFTAFLCAIMVVGTATMAYADFYMAKFSYTSYYPGIDYSTSSRIKNDDTSAIAEYSSGPADKMYFEIWAANGTSADAANYTVSHLENGIYVKHYTAKKGFMTMIPNTVYESYKWYNGPVYTKLKVEVYGTGTASGRWSPSTN